MGIQVTVRDRYHDGSTPVVFTTIIYPTSFNHMVDLMIEVMGSYPIAEV